MNQLLPGTPFGFTEDSVYIERVRVFVAAAVADGWGIKPTYETHEGVDRAATLNRDGWTMMVLTRTHEKTKRYEVDVSIWSPDRLAAVVPNEYSWEEIQRGARVCHYCKGEFEPENLQRIGFAGRACNTCHAANVRRVEFPGWTN